MSYEEISAELDQKFTELGQNFGRVRPKIGPELGVKFWKKNPAYGAKINDEIELKKINKKLVVNYCQKHTSFHANLVL